MSYNEYVNLASLPVAGMIVEDSNQIVDTCVQASDSTIGDGLFVKLTDGKMVLCGAGESPYGISMVCYKHDRPRVDSSGSFVRPLLIDGGIISLTVDVAVKKGTYLTTGADGIATTSTGAFFAIATQDSYTLGSGENVINVVPALFSRAGGASGGSGGGGVTMDQVNTAIDTKTADFIKKDVADLENYYDKTTSDGKYEAKATESLNVESGENQGVVRRRNNQNGGNQ
jgi:hypothetical protein